MRLDKITKIVEDYDYIIILSVPYMDCFYHILFDFGYI